MPTALREQLIQMALHWERVGEERELALATGSSVPDLRPDSTETEG